jgi:Gnt-I system high-affinity gluconate transporter
LGSATVAAITAGGIVAPLIATTGVSPELMVIAVGSGSVIFSHVNDPGFWLFKEYFNLTIGETIKSWSMLETIISVCGLVGVLLLNGGLMAKRTANRRVFYFFFTTAFRAYPNP